MRKVKNTLTHTTSTFYKSKGKRSENSKPHQGQHKKSKTNLKIYRSYDKQHLLHEIGNKIQMNQEAKYENRILKSEVTKSQAFLPANRLSHGQSKLLIANLKEQNRKLRVSAEQKQKQNSKLKKTMPYSQFCQIYIEYERNKEQFCRLKLELRRRKRQRMQIQKMNKNAKNEEKKEIEDKRNDAHEIIANNYSIKAQVQDLQRQLQKIKSKNTQLEKNKRKHIDDINEINARLIQFSNTPSQSKLKLSNNSTDKFNQFNSNIFCKAVKTKKLLVSSPILDPEIEKSLQSPQNICEKDKWKGKSAYNNEDQNLNLQQSDNSESQGQQMD